jgi:tetratricopeptide (TPR) repeat protein
MDAAQWHLLALAHLERALLRSHDRGIVVGAPVFDEQPRELLADLDAGLAAASAARKNGDDSSELFRIEAGLLSQRIVDLGTALQWNGKVQEALQRANERQRDNPHLHVALGLRKLLAPRWLGHDPKQALEHFEFAAKALTDDERPAVFAAMATFLQKKRLQAIAWLEQAVARNPQNRFARVVLARLRAGEDDPFGRHVTAAEAAATK